MIYFFFLLFGPEYCSSGHLWGFFLLNSSDTSPTSVNHPIACKEKCFSINLARIPTLKIQNELYL